mmetsp:Transcript_38867/g.49622  ORF Transcript_38867/g.49622 Transcript_38867/m.49622 type:complete len:421 (+) Transcript_38867:89-1351(+)
MVSQSNQSNLENSLPDTNVTRLEEAYLSEPIQLWRFVQNSKKPNYIRYYAEPHFGAEVRIRYDQSWNKMFIRSYDTVDENWIKVYYDRGQEGWLPLRSENNVEELQQVHSYHRYQEWPGNNYFFCHGKIMFGSDIGIFIFTNCMIISAFLLFLCFTLPQFSKHFSILVSIPLGLFGTCLMLSSLYNLWKTGSSDPGIIPRNHPNIIVQEPEDEDNDDGSSGYRYCETCNVYRPPRAKHCHACDNCVAEFDHHCPWVGNCVAGRNYHYFVRFVFSTLCLSLFVAVCSFSWLVLEYKYHTDLEESDQERVGEVADHDSPTIVLVAFTGLISWSLIGLCVMHCFLIGTGQTTNQFILRQRRRNHEGGVGSIQDASPSRRLNLCNNIKYLVLCPKIPESQLPKMNEKITITEADIDNHSDRTLL